MEQIKPTPQTHDAQRALRWLCTDSNSHVGAEELNNIVRLLIAKINELGTEVEYLRNRVNNIDRIINQ